MTVSAEDSIQWPLGAFPWAKPNFPAWRRLDGDSHSPPSPGYPSLLLWLVENGKNALKKGISHLNEPRSHINPVRSPPCHLGPPSSLKAKEQRADHHVEPWVELWARGRVKIH